MALAFLSKLKRFFFSWKFLFVVAFLWLLQFFIRQQFGLFNIIRCFIRRFKLTESLRHDWRDSEALIARKVMWFCFCDELIMALSVCYWLRFLAIRIKSWKEAISRLFYHDKTEVSTHAV